MDHVSFSTGEGEVFGLPATLFFKNFLNRALVSKGVCPQLGIFTILTSGVGGGRELNADDTLSRIRCCLVSSLFAKLETRMRATLVKVLKVLSAAC